MRYGGLFSLICATLGLALSFAFAIVATGRRQTFAIGFALPVFSYLAIVLMAGQKEYEWTDGFLPTTKLLGYLYEPITIRTFHVGRDQFIQESEVESYQAKGMRVMVTQNVDEGAFMLTGHGCIGLLLGWLGGRFALLASATKT